MLRCTTVAMAIALAGCGGAEVVVATCEAPRTDTDEARCARGADFERLALPMMGLTIEVLAPGDQSVEAAQTVVAVFAKVDAATRDWRAGKPNAAPHIPKLARRADELAQLTEGAFDPAAPAHRAAVALGHAIARAARKLRQADVTDFQIRAGGQVLSTGRRGAKPWVVLLREPRAGKRERFARLALEGPFADASIVTRIGDGRSATLIGGPAHRIAPLADAVLAMGTEAGLALVESLEGLEAVVVDEAAAVFASTGLHGHLQVLHPPRARP